jgi:hypothetical protein
MSDTDYRNSNCAGRVIARYEGTVVEVEPLCSHHLITSAE